MMNRALFIFRRDLRLEDNTGLLFACRKAKDVVLCFIFTPEQIDRNAYRSDHCLQFLIESLEDLDEQIRKRGGKLYLFHGKTEDVVAKCITELSVDAVVVNRDYTPYSIKRDRTIESLCKKRNVDFYALDDALLHAPEETLKSDGKPYTVFTPYFRNASRFKVQKPVANRFSNYYSRPISWSKDRSLYHKILPKRHDQQTGGRSECLKILKGLKKHSRYSTKREFPAEMGTTHLSPHLKFTTCSPREIYYAIAKSLTTHSELIRSLYWRDFFTSIAFYFPRVFEGAFKIQFNRIAWNKNKNVFKRWCSGQTGVPIVDAGMRELNQTGFMHNRVRMISASFLIKDLHIDWRWGEKYFAQGLIDYDPAVNNGNWQWVASTGCDAQPYFRIFNPWTQALKFDPDCVYIKRWIPELASLSAKEIHAWHQEKCHESIPSYPAPIVDHPTEAQKSLNAYKKLRAK